MKHIISSIPFLVPQSDTVRKKWVIRELKKIPKGKSILDAGAGECQYRKFCSHLRYTSQDFNKYDGKGDCSGIQTGKRNRSDINIVSDIIDIPVADASFDAVLCVEVFEHIPRPLDALKELRRVLKKGGILILTAPFSSLTHYAPYYYYSGFSPYFYKENLPRHGFTILKHETTGNYFDHLALEILRTPLVLWSINKIKSIPFLLLYPVAIPLYALLRMLSYFFPESSSYYHFTNCLVAKKKS